jgi:hypothetical protein
LPCFFRVFCIGFRIVTLPSLLVFHSRHLVLVGADPRLSGCFHLTIH